MTRDFSGKPADSTSYVSEKTIFTDVRKVVREAREQPHKLKMLGLLIPFFINNFWAV
jgi:hypothetical protein